MREPNAPGLGLSIPQLFPKLSQPQLRGPAPRQPRAQEANPLPIASSLPQDYDFAPTQRDSSPAAAPKEKLRRPPARSQTVQRLQPKDPLSASQTLKLAGPTCRDPAPRDS